MGLWCTDNRVKFAPLPHVEALLYSEQSMVYRESIKSHFPKALLSIGVFLFLAGSAHAETIEVYSKQHQIDRVIKSMEGTVDDENFSLLKSDKPELLWVTASRVMVVDANTHVPESADMLCHSHMMFPYANFNSKKHNSLFGFQTNLDIKLFTVVQGQTDIQLPRNFAIPVLSNETFAFSSMIISPRHPPTPLQVQAKATFETYRDYEMKTPT